MSKTGVAAWPDEAIVVCIMSHASGPGDVCNRWRKYRGSHPAVKRNPGYFLAEPFTDQDMTDALNRMFPMDPPVERTTTKIITPIKDEDAMLCIRRCGEYPLGGQPGKRYAKSDPVVRQFPKAFVPIATPGVPKERAVIVPQDCETIAADGTSRKAIAGTWVDQDDPFVKWHPNLAWRRPW